MVSANECDTNKRQFGKEKLAQRQNICSFWNQDENVNNLFFDSYLTRYIYMEPDSYGGWRQLL